MNKRNAPEQLGQPPAPRTSIFLVMSRCAFSLPVPSSCCPKRCSASGVMLGSEASTPCTAELRGGDGEGGGGEAWQVSHKFGMMAGNGGRTPARLAIAWVAFQCNHAAGCRTLHRLVAQQGPRGAPRVGQLLHQDVADQGHDVRLVRGHRLRGGRGAGQGPREAGLESIMRMHLASRQAECVFNPPATTRPAPATPPQRPPTSVARLLMAALSTSLPT